MKWTVTLEGGSEREIVISGGKGRVSYSENIRTGGTARFYRNETTKVYDAVFSGVRSIVSERVTVVKTVPSPVTFKASVSKHGFGPPPWTIEKEDDDTSF